jgi:hypothetical protein
MMTIQIENLTFEHLLHPDVLADPSPLFRRLRCEDPVHEDPTGRARCSPVRNLRMYTISCEAFAHDPPYDRQSWPLPTLPAKVGG